MPKVVSVWVIRGVSAKPHVAAFPVSRAQPPRTAQKRPPSTGPFPPSTAKGEQLRSHSRTFPIMSNRPGKPPWHVENEPASWTSAAGPMPHAGASNRLPLPYGISCPSGLHAYRHSLAKTFSESARASAPLRSGRRGACRPTRNRPTHRSSRPRVRAPARESRARSSRQGFPLQPPRRRRGTHTPPVAKRPCCSRRRGTPGSWPRSPPWRRCSTVRSRRRRSTGAPSSWTCTAARGPRRPGPHPPCLPPHPRVERRRRPRRVRQKPARPRRLRPRPPPHRASSHPRRTSTPRGWP